MRREYAKQNKAKSSRRHKKQYLPKSPPPPERVASRSAIFPNTKMASRRNPQKHSAVGGQVKKRKARGEMSGDGLISARIPRSLLQALQASAQRQGISLHEAARRLTDKLPSLTQADLRGLKEPPREPDSPRVSRSQSSRSSRVLAGTISCARSSALPGSRRTSGYYVRDFATRHSGLLRAELQLPKSGSR